MGVLHDQIQAILADGALTDAEKRAQIVDVRRSAVRSAVQGALPYTASFIKNGNTWAITVESASLYPGGVELVLSVTRNGQPRPFNNPWRIINPPLLVPDDTGDVTMADGRKFREAPLLALREAIRGLV